MRAYGLLFVTAVSIFASSFHLGIATSVNFDNPVTVNTMSDLVDAATTYLSGLVVAIAILFIVLGGIYYMMSGGDPAMTKRAYSFWTSAVIGFTIVAVSKTILKEVVNILGGPTAVDTGTPIPVEQIIANILNLLLSLLGMICIISLTIAGSMYMTAYGDDKQITSAKSIAKYSIIGLAVALSSLVVISTVDTLITGGL